MTCTCPSFLYSNRLRDGHWHRDRVLLVSPGPAVDLGSTTHWEPATPAGVNRWDLESLTCTATTGGRALALRRLHASASSWQAITVHGVWLPDGDQPVDRARQLRNALRIEPSLLAKRCTTFRGRPDPESVRLADPGNGPSASTGRADPPTVIAAQRALQRGRRVAIIGADEPECAEVVLAVLAGLPPDHTAASSWSTLESDGFAGLALIGVVRSLWRGPSPEQLGYLAIVVGPDGGSPPDPSTSADVWQRSSEVARDAAPRAEGSSRCPACGLPALVEVRYTQLRQDPGHASELLRRAVDSLRTFRCSTCGVSIQQQDPTPVVVLGPVASGKSSFILAALQESQASTSRPHLSSTGTIGKAGPWQVRELSAHAPSGQSHQLVLEAPQGSTWQAPLRRIAERPAGGLVVVCVDANQLVNGPPPRGARPGCESEAARLHRDVGAILAMNPRWTLMTVVTRAPSSASAGAADRLIGQLGGRRVIGASRLPPDRLMSACVTRNDSPSSGATTGAYVAISHWLNRRSTR